MDLSKQKRSKNVETYTPKGSPPGTTGIKGDRLYNSPEYKSAINDASTAFQDKINQRQGKGDRQNGPDSPMTSAIKAIMKNKKFNTSKVK